MILIMIFILGLIAGILLLGFAAVILYVYQTPITRSIRQAQSNFSKKGTIIEPESQELETWLKELNDE